MDRAVLLLCVVGCSFQPGRGGSDGDSFGTENDASIPTEVAADAAPRAFDPATDCPASYTTTLSDSTSRYRIVTATSTAWPQYALCNSDLPERTHAVVLGTMGEVMALDATLDTMGTIDRFYVGGVQNPAANARDAGWIAFDGSTLIGGAWHSAESEPDDGTADLVENQGQQLLIFDRTLTYLHDATGVTAYGIVCECDGVAMHATATGYVDRDPNRPK